MKGQLKRTAGGRRRAKREIHALTGRMPSGRVCAPDEVKSAWSATQTRTQNLRRLGLATGINDIFGDNINNINDGSVNGNGNVVELLQMRADRGEKKIAKRASPGEIAFVKKAVEKYGFDYRRIQRDIKLNYFQWNVIFIFMPSSS